MPNGRAPPILPGESDLEDAVQLCGKVKRRGTLCLSQYERERIVRYCGRMPTSKDEAHRWKIYLRALRREVDAEPDPEA